MFIEKLNDVEIICKFTHNEFYAMGFTNNFIEEIRASQSFVEALMDFALEETNINKKKIGSTLNIEIDHEKKLVIATIDFGFGDFLKHFFGREFDDELGIGKDYNIDHSKEYQNYKMKMREFLDPSSIREEKLKKDRLYVIKRKDIDDIINLTSLFGDTFPETSSLYRQGNQYKLVFGMNEHVDKVLLALADFGQVETITGSRLAYIMEHNEAIIKEDAFNKLKLMI